MVVKQAKRIDKAVLYMHDFFNQVTEHDLPKVADQQRSAHGERLFRGRPRCRYSRRMTMNPDSSCQATLDRHAMQRIANHLRPCSKAMGARCKAWPAACDGASAVVSHRNIAREPHGQLHLPRMDR